MGRPLPSPCGYPPGARRAAKAADASHQRPGDISVHLAVVTPMQVIDAYRDSLMPWWEQTPGFCSNSLMVDRREGRCAAAVGVESREAMAHTRHQFTTLREEFVARMSMEIVEAAEFDLALARLRVPETV
jgi:hypothetical protein